MKTPKTHLATSKSFLIVSPMSIAELHQLPRTEKLRIIEALWDDLASDDKAPIASPAWHFEELQKTDERLRSGTEEILDWQDAKAELRGRFE